MFRIFEELNLCPFAHFTTGALYSRLRFYRESYHYEFFGGLRCRYPLPLHQIWAWSVHYQQRSISGQESLETHTHIQTDRHTHRDWIWYSTLPIIGSSNKLLRPWRMGIRGQVEPQATVLLFCALSSFSVICERMNKQESFRECRHLHVCHLRP